MREHRRDGFPVTIVRPSLTYGPSFLPLCVNSHRKPWTVVDRMRRGKKVIVPGDGTSLWTVTWNEDFAKGFVGLLGNRQAVGQAFHITSDEVLTWNRIYRTVGRAAGVEARLAHVPTDIILAWCPGEEGTLLGDKVHSTVFDNSKIKRLVPDFVATTAFAEGVREVIAWFDAEVARRGVDEEADRRWDAMVAACEGAARAAPPT